MECRSPGLRTDLMLARFDGEVCEHDDYVVARTPTSPNFWWGNFIIFRDPPSRDCLVNWEQTFDHEFPLGSDVGHRNFTWEPTTEDGECESLLAAGYSLARDGTYLTAERMDRPAQFNSDVRIRPIAGDAEWHAAVNLQHATIAGGYDTTGFRRFQSAQSVRYRAMVEAGFGDYFGAFLDGRLVAAMGLFGTGGVMRCQSVSTDPGFQRRGICRTLVHDCCEWGLREAGAREIVMFTGREDAAIRVYRSVGFQEREQVASLSIAAR